MAKTNMRIAEAKELIESLNQSLNKCARPKSGVMAQMLSYGADIDAYRQEISGNSQRLFGLESYKQDLIFRLKTAHMELEKMKYLEEQEKLAKAAKLKRIESNDLDEIGLMLYSNRKAL